MGVKSCRKCGVIVVIVSKMMVEDLNFTPLLDHVNYEIGSWHLVCTTHRP